MESMVDRLLLDLAWYRQKQSVDMTQGLVGHGK